MSIKSFPISLFFELQECNNYIPEKKEAIVLYIREYLKRHSDGAISFYLDNKPDRSRLLSQAAFQRPKATAYYNDGTARYYDVYNVRLCTNNKVDIVLTDGSHIFDIEKELKIEELISLVSAIVRYDTIVNFTIKPGY